MLDISIGPLGEVALAGELDLATAPSVTDALERAITASNDLEVDVRDLTFIDLAGVRTLIHAANRIEGIGDLVLRSPSRAVAKVLDLVRVDTLPNIYVVDRRAATGEEVVRGADHDLDPAHESRVGDVRMDGAR